MGWSVPIGAVRGTVIRIHLTFLLFLAWIAFVHWRTGGPQAAMEGVVFILLIFLCVLLHEFGHVFAARRYGVTTPDITLLPIGGVARLERIPEKPGQELVVALAGPAVNVVIALLLILFLGGLPPAQGAELQDPGTSMLARLTWVNIILVGFNLVPAFPMDGGRVLRALLAMRMGNGRATQIAASVGQGVAFLFGILGLLGGNPLLVFIALFVYLGAVSEAHAVQMREATRSMLASDAMITRFESLPPSATVGDAAELLIRTTQHDFPIVDGSGRLRGVLTRNDMIRALREAGPQAPALDAMRRDVPSVHYRQALEEAMKVMQSGSHPAVAITDSEGRLQGLITPENIGEMMMLEAARPTQRVAPRNPWARGP